MWAPSLPSTSRQFLGGQYSCRYRDVYRIEDLPPKPHTLNRPRTRCNCARGRLTKHAGLKVVSMQPTTLEPILHPVNVNLACSKRAVRSGLSMMTQKMPTTMR